MNETFSFKRFAAYFKYDIARMWHVHGKALLLFSLIGVMTYFVWVFFGLIFGGGWKAPGFEVRIVVFLILSFIVEIYMARLYGYLTKKHEGSSWILLPASKAEKFVSMLLQALIIVPVCVFAVYLCADWLLCLIDHGCGQSLIAGYSELFNSSFGDENMVEAMNVMGLSPLGFLLISIVGGFVNYLFFLLCGICFKKNKIIFGFLIIFALSVVMSTLSAIVLPLLNYDGLVNMDEAGAINMLRGFLTVFYVLLVVMMIGLGWGVWKRISTIKH